MWINDNGLKFSNDEGVSWQNHPTIQFRDIEYIFANGSEVTFIRIVKDPNYLGIYHYYTYYSNDNGETFVKRDEEPIALEYTLDASTNPVGIYEKSSTEIIEIREGRSYFINFTYSTYLNITEDNGISWTSQSLFSTDSFLGLNPMKFSIQRDTLSTLFQQEDSTWLLNIYTDDYENPVLHTFTILEDIKVEDFHYQDNQLTLFIDDGSIFSSQDLGQTWINYPSNIPGTPNGWEIKFELPHILVNLDSQLYSIQYDDLGTQELIYESSVGKKLTVANAEIGVLVSDQEGIFLKPSEDEMLSRISDGIGGRITHFKATENIVWAKSETWYRSEGEEIIWTPTPLEILDDSNILTDYNGILILEKDKEVFQSTDNGFTWNSVLSFQYTPKIEEYENGIYL